MRTASRKPKRALRPLVPRFASASWDYTRTLKMTDDSDMIGDGTDYRIECERRCAVLGVMLCMPVLGAYCCIIIAISIMITAAAAAAVAAEAAAP